MNKMLVAGPFQQVFRIDTVSVGVGESVVLTT